MTLAYSTELTTDQYELLSTLIPPEARIGRPRTVNMRLVIQGIVYVLMSGCVWRLLPNQYPPHDTVYYCLVALFTAGNPPSARRYLSKWRNDGIWKRMQDQLVI
jgi:transposase